MYEDFFIARLACLRMTKNVSARDMSLAIGQNKNYINQIENGKAFPSMQVFFYICEYLEISPKDFFDEKTENPALLNELIDLAQKTDAETLRPFVEIFRMIGKETQGK